MCGYSTLNSQFFSCNLLVLATRCGKFDFTVWCDFTCARASHPLHNIQYMYVPPGDYVICLEPGAISGSYYLMTNVCMCRQVTTYKVITLHKGAAQQRSRQQEASIPEGVVSSPEGSAGTGTSQSSPGMNLMETWCAALPLSAPY